MKKWLLAMAAVLLVCAAAPAQKNRDFTDTKGFLVVAAGPAIPLSNFGSSNLNNEDAGLAKTGFTINVHVAYHFRPGYGVKTTAFYTRNEVDNISTPQGELDIDHWQYYGAVIGPMLRAPLGSSLVIDFAVLTGIADVNTYKALRNNEIVVDEDWSLTMPLKAEAALRFRVNKSLQLQLGADFLYMSPDFDIKVDGISREEEQKIHVMSILAGVGFNF